MQAISPLNSIGKIFTEEINWFQAFCKARTQYLEAKDERAPNFVPAQIFEKVPLPLRRGDSPYDLLCQKLWTATQKQFSPPEASYQHCAERMALILALLPHFHPGMTDHLKKLDLASGGILNSVQGVQAQTFLPCAETALYLLAGNNLDLRLNFQSIFYPKHLFAQEDILKLEDTPLGVPLWRGALQISEEVLYLLATGQAYETQMSPNFPAQKLTTEQTWDDFVVPYHTHEKVMELLDWIKHYEQLATHPHFARERKGYRCLLVGEPGTGKTMLGRLLSQETNRPVYRISLEKIVSKYVGETTKNIAKVFNTARHRNWILFCDEGDALFSKRSTKGQSAQDTYVNQDIAYLLQEIEDYPGIILVATNYAQNMDKAFQRRFDTRIDFRKPDYGEIIQLFEKALQAFRLDEEIKISFVAQELMTHVTAAQITKFKHYLGLQALKRQDWSLSVENFCEGLQKNNIRIPDFAGRRARMNRYQKR